MEESRWIYSGYMPTFEEYLENGVRTIGAPLATTYAFFYALDRDTISKHSLEWIQRPDSEFLYLAALIGRLYDDLLTSEVCITHACALNTLILSLTHVFLIKKKFFLKKWNEPFEG